MTICFSRPGKGQVRAALDPKAPSFGASDPLKTGSGRQKLKKEKAARNSEKTSNLHCFNPGEDYAVTVP